MTADDAIQKLAGELPPGWDVELAIERGAGSVHLFDPEGNGYPIDGADRTIAEQLLEALRQAQECVADPASLPPPPPEIP